MKRIFLLIMGICCIGSLSAQTPVNVVVSTGTTVVMTGSVQTTFTNVSGTPAFTNNGTYTDNAGTLNDKCGLTFSGSGTTGLYNLGVNHAGTTLFNSLVSVYNTTTLAAGSMNANNELYVRSDAGNATMVNNGSLTNNVKGLIVKASATTGSCPSYTSNLSLNISGTEMAYQWQSSADSISWSDVGGATNPTYSVGVSSTVYYRCNLSALNTVYAESTPGVKLTLPVPPGAISGIQTVCTSATISLSNTSAGGSWSSLNSSVATIDASSGVVSGASQGITTISYTNGCGSGAAYTVTVNATPATIGGNTQMCAGGTTIGLTNTSANGTWSGGTAGIATVNSASGLVTPGSTQGTTIISYTNGCGAAATITASVNATPAIINGNTQMCTGSPSISLTNTSANGTWSGGTAGIATVNTTSGLVTPGAAQGVAIISYTNGCGLAASITATVNAAPAPIGGNTPLCAGSTTISLTNTSANGTWSGGTAGIATVNNATGIVTAGTSQGTTIISYSNGCGTATSITASVNATPSSIAGSTSLCQNVTATLSNSADNGIWSSQNSSVATIDPATGVISGVSKGIASITYSTGCGTDAQIAIGVIPIPDAIFGASVLCAGTTTQLTDASGAGTWTSSDPGIATVNPSSGVAGVSGGGTAIITYSTGCGTDATLTVSATGAIAGAASVFMDSTLVLTAAPSGGVWSSSSTAIATVDGAGTVTGVIAGSVVISYTVGLGCSSTATVLVKPNAVGVLCVGQVVTFFDTVAGGTWSSSDNSFATVVTATGVTSGVYPGTLSILHHAAGGYLRSFEITVHPLSPTTGLTTVCQGLTIALANGTSGGGTWSSSNGLIASVAGTGVVSGLSGGSVVVTFTSSAGCMVTSPVTVNPVGAVAGPIKVCVGQAVTLSDGVAGGTWSSSNASYATVGASTGIVSGVLPGSTTMKYTLPTGCLSTLQMTVNPLSATTGLSTVCQGQSIALVNSTSGGGVWSSGNTSVATASAGTVGGVGGGSAVISFTTAAGCVATTNVTVNAAAAITGPSKACAGQTIALSDAISGGTWSSTNPSYATVVASTGVVSGVLAGSLSIKYVSPSGCSNTFPLTVGGLSATTPATPATICSGHTVVLTNSTSGGGTWSIGNTAVAHMVSSTSTYATIGWVAPGTSVIYFTTTSAGCVTTTTITAGACRDADTSNTTEVGTVQSGMEDVRLFPNPNSGAFFIKGALASQEDAEVDVEITNMLGQVVYRKKIIAQGGSINEQVQLDNTIANSMYIVSVRSGADQKVFHIVIER